MPSLWRPCATIREPVIVGVRFSWLVCLWLAHRQISVQIMLHLLDCTVDDLLSPLFTITLHPHIVLASCSALGPH